MQRFKNVLVGVDLSDGGRYVSDRLTESSQTAFNKAVWLAEHTGARLTVASIVMPCLDLTPDAEHLIAAQHLASVVQDVYRKADEVLDGLVRQARDRRINASAYRTCGHAWYELIRLAAERNNDLVVVGSHHRSMLGELVLGSTGKRLIRKCPCPVWVTSPREDGSIRRILVPTDFSETARHALEIAASMAERLPAELHVLHAVSDHVDAVFREFPVAGVEVADYQDRLIADAGKQLQKLLAEMQVADDVKADHRHVLTGSPASAIHRVVREAEIDLVIMGTQARHGIAGVLLGNIAERILPELTCSVLAVKPDGFRCPIQFPEASAT